MPLYDYECKKCGASFEALVRDPSPSVEVNCEHCGGADVERKISSFHAASSSSYSTPNQGGGSCSTGSCGCC